jgi:alanine or glycine:cation symporter, AGCS family
MKATIPLLSLALVLPAAAAHAQLAERVDARFALATGWFVDLVFATLPTEGLIGVDLPWIVGWLVVGATVFTIYFGAIQIRAFGMRSRWCAAGIPTRASRARSTISRR